MTHHELTIGQIRCVVVPDRSEVITHANLSGIFPESPEIQAVIQSQPEPLRFSMNCLLIETDRQRILVDTGLGTTNPTRPPQLLDNLAGIGLTPDDIKVVLITHGHMDHLGGLVTAEGALVFANARCLMPRIDYEHWTGPAAQPQSEALYQAIQPRLELIEPNHQIAPGVYTFTAHGHTPGHVGVVIESGGQKLMHVVDSTHHPLQTAQPTWSPRFDTDPVQSAATRRALFTQAADEGCWLMAYHYGFPGIGTVTRVGDAFEFHPLV